MAKKAHDWTAKQSLKHDVVLHTTSQPEGQVPDQWLTDSSFHICPVCSRLISSRTTPCCPKRHPTSHFTERPLHPDTPDLDEVHSTRVPLRTQTSKTAHEARAAASWLPSQESPPTTTHEPGQIYCPFRRWCFDGNVEASVRKQCEQWLEGAVLSGGNHVPLPNANENPTTHTRPRQRQKRFPKETPWRKRTSCPRHAPHCSTNLRLSALRH